jgi:hypothetical protein
MPILIGSNKPPAELTLAECKKYVDATLNINVYKVL